MVGYSKWLEVKHSRGPLDVGYGGAFDKLVKEFIMAALFGGADLSGISPIPTALALFARPGGTLNVVPKTFSMKPAHPAA